MKSLLASTMLLLLQHAPGTAGESSGSAPTPDAPTVTLPKSELDDLKNRVQRLEKQNNSLADAVQAAGEKPAPPRIPDETFTVDGTAYRFMSPIFIRDGQKVTAVDALADETLLRELVEKKSALIQQVRG